MSAKFVFTSESVSEGHPDKVCDYIADSILDAHLEQDPKSRVACEVMCKDDHVVLAGEITSGAIVNVEEVTRRAIREIGYDDRMRRFNAGGVSVLNFLGQQASDIARGVDNGNDLGAGDQGMVFGFATDETPERMPAPISLAHRVTRALAEARKNSRVSWLRPDAKSQVSVRYENDRPVEITAVVVSTQHAFGTPQDQIHQFVLAELLPEALGKWWREGIRVLVIPQVSFRSADPKATVVLPVGRLLSTPTVASRATVAALSAEKIPQKLIAVPPISHDLWHNKSSNAVSPPRWKSK